ncbi:MAG TPA: hypothetical protein VNM92_14150 [Thermoanaerobaculia bacterium]|nr:hypothetical protein [Thermoanaerobaculia bacterium]
MGNGGQQAAGTRRASPKEERPLLKDVQIGAGIDADERCRQGDRAENENSGNEPEARAKLLEPVSRFDSQRGAPVTSFAVGFNFWLAIRF